MPVADSPALDLRTKRCTLCGEVKRWREFYACKKWPDGTMRVAQSRCKDCRHKADHARMRANPERWTRQLERIRQYERNLDPERRAVRREANRNSKRRLGGITPERWRVDRPGVGTGTASETVDAAPLAAFFRTLGDGPGEVASRVKMDPSYVGKVMKDAITRIELDTVDRALLHANAVVDGLPVTLDTLYPIEEAAA